MFKELGRHGAVTYSVEESKPGELWKNRIADSNLPYGGTWTFALKPAGKGTELTITEDGEVYNPLFRFLSTFVFSRKAGMKAYLRDLGKKWGGNPGKG